ncbi:lachesin-like [Chelonus insularis]|uniref:lachesin-like n=1 Tax=Chelonus insularis TaxID=460826 RepID=UPI00158BBA6E|nr:lachesin-like [Chelonus insularis]XP_034939145.1 lachesin-like [Chelonus insularis]
MYSLRIAVVLAVFLVCQVYCSSDQFESKDDLYADDDPPSPDYDEEPEEDDSNGTPAEPPEIRTKPLTLRTNQGETVELPCDVVNAEDFTISWYKDNITLSFGDALIINDKKRITVAANHSLIIHNVTREDSSSNYTCQIVSNPPIKLVHSLHVTRAESPLSKDDTITVYPARKVEIDENGTITLRCTSTLVPPSEIKWFHKGTRLNNSHGIEVNENSVTLRKVTRHHSGHYQCLAEDKSETPPSQSIEVLVNFAPVIEVDHDVIHTGIAVETELVCRVHAHPHARVSWTKNDKPISLKKEKKYMTDDKNHRVLTIYHTNKHDFGKYKCIAKNPLGEAYKEILVEGTPAKPEFIGGEIADDETTMILKWKVKSFSPIVEYKLEYREKGDKEWKVLSPSVQDGSGNEFVVEHAIKGLQPSVSYEATLVAKNDFGWSPNAKIHTFSKEYASDEPQNVKGKSDATTTRSFAALTAVLLVLSYITMNV